MSARYTFRKTFTRDKYNTYVVTRNGNIVGRARVLADDTQPGRRWEIKRPSDDSFHGAYKTRKSAADVLANGGPVPEQKRYTPNTGGTPTDVVCACGHTYKYNIKRASAVDWLKGKPCPPCGRKGWKPEDGTQPEPQPEQRDDTPEPEEDPEPEPQPEPEPEPEHDYTDEIAALLNEWPSIPDGEAVHSAFADLLLLLDAGLPVWLQGPPGTGKSTMAEQAARALSTTFHPLSCHEMMTRTDLFGYRDAAGNDHRTPLWDAYENGGVFLLDEVDNGNPNLLAALNSAMSNGHCVFGSGTVVPRHPDFRVIATANTAGLGPEAGYIGRNGVDLATRDRFVTVLVPIDPVLEAALAAIGLGDEQVREDAEAMSFNAGARPRCQRLPGRDGASQAPTRDTSTVRPRERAAAPNVGTVR